MCGLRVDIQSKVFATVLEFWILLSRDTTDLTHFDTLWVYHITNIFYLNSYHHIPTVSVTSTVNIHAYSHYPINITLIKKR